MKLKLPLILFLFIGITFKSTFCQSVYCPSNLDFENKNFTNWEFYLGTAQNNGTAFISNLSYPLNQNITDSTNHSLTNSGVDLYGNFPTNCNFLNGSTSVKLGDDFNGGLSARLKYKISVPANNNAYKVMFYYALVLESPYHNLNEQPSFRMNIIDSITNSVISSCSNFEFAQPPGNPLPGFKLAKNFMPYKTYYLPWTASSLNLSGLAGKTIYIQFDVSDCTQFGHFGYGYIDFPPNCSIDISNFKTNCISNTTAQIIAPGGFSSYKWYDSSLTTLLSSNDTLLISLSPLDTFKHYCVMEPLNNWGCIDTVLFKYTISNSVISNFSLPSNYCTNSNINFFDNSMATNPGSFITNWDWSFGDNNATLSNPNNSTLQNPSHIYNQLGTYTVCLKSQSNINCVTDSICQTILINRNVNNQQLLKTKDSICGLIDTVTIYSNSQPIPNHKYFWEIDSNTVLINGNINSFQPIVVKFNTKGNHIIKLLSSPNVLDTICPLYSSVSVYVKGIKSNINIFSVDSACVNTSIELDAFIQPNYCSLGNNNCTATKSVNIGNDSIQNSQILFLNYTNNYKSQLLLTKTELNQLGFYGGAISKLEFIINNKNTTTPYRNFRISIGCSNDSILPSYKFDTTTNVLEVATIPFFNTTLGSNLIVFNNSYNWDGVSNLLIQICFDNDSFSISNTIYDEIKSSKFTNGYYCENYNFVSVYGPCDKKSIINGNQPNYRPNIKLYYCNDSIIDSTIIYNWFSFTSGLLPYNAIIFDTLKNNNLYNLTVNDNGCTNTASKSIKVVSEINKKFSQTLCGGFPFQYNGHTYTKSGNYNEIISSHNGCDTVVNLELTFSYNYAQANIQSCGNYLYHGILVTKSGNYYDTIKSTNAGCDTVNVTYVDIVPFTSTTYKKKCNTKPLNYNGKIYNRAGTYIDTIKISPCYTIDTLIIENIFDTSITIINVHDTLFCNNNTSGLFFINWVNCDSNYTKVSSNKNFFTPTSPGHYAIIINYGSCFDTTNCFAFNTLPNNTTLILDEKLQLKVYPNPTKNYLNISCNTNSISTIVVTDLLGRIVPCEWTKTYSTLKHSYYQLQTNFILSGNYFIKIITTTGNTINSKFVKE